MFSYGAMNRAVGNQPSMGPVHGPITNPNAHAYGPKAPGFEMSYQGNRGAARAGLAGFNARLSQSAIGSALKTGTMESFGWSMPGGVSQGFLGLSEEFSGTRVSHAMRQARTFGQNQYKAGFKALGRAAKQAGVGGTVKYSTGLAGRTLGKSFGILSTGYFAYTGYQEEGVWGAVKGIGESIATTAAFNYITGSAFADAMYLAAPVAGIAAVVGGTYLLGEAGIEHAKGLRDMEMGGGDQVRQAIGSAGVATARQRSLMALNNTHINGRMALGNEGFLLHRGFSA